VRVPCDGPFTCGLVKRQDAVSGAYTITVRVAVDGPATPGCTVSQCFEAQPADAAEFVVTNPREVAFDLWTTCNGVYDIVANATAVSPLGSADRARLDRQVAVSMPAPEVTGVAAEPDADGRAVTVRWDDMRPAAPD